jgi:class 3 adenylate cyclase
MRELKRDLPLGTVTFLCTDIEGSTQLVAKMWPKAGRNVLTASASRTGRRFRPRTSVPPRW